MEGKRKSLNASSTLYTDKLPSTYYTEAEQEEIEAMYMELSPKQERDSVFPDPRPETSPKMEEQDHSPHQDIIPTPDMIPALEQESIDLNLLEGDQNPQFMIDHKHNLEHRTFPPFNALAADVIIVIKTRKL